MSSFKKHSDTEATFICDCGLKHDLTFDPATEEVAVETYHKKVTPDPAVEDPAVTAKKKRGIFSVTR